MISLRHITIRRGSRVLLEDINWTIFKEQRIGLIGANGSGKSTLFALLQGTITPDAGDLDIPKHLKMAHLAQETPALSQSALDYVLDGDDELRTLEKQLLDALQQNDGTLIASLHGEMARIDAYTATARAAQLLNGLGFTHQDQHKLVREFSGGWRVRLNLAKALMTRSDILLLDEPTNHLDLDAVLWLEQWLLNYPGTLIIISHDREFLDTTVNHIAHITHQALKLYTGNYTAFESLRAADLLLQQAMYEKQQQQMTHMKDYIDRFRYKASKARQAQSRIKALERMELVCAVQADSPFEFHFAEPKQQPNTLLSLQHATIAYDDRIVLRHIHLTIQAKDRIAILGPNGAGKSSLIKVLAQQLKPSAGQLETASGLQIGYFAQHQVDQLRLHESPLSHMRDLAKNTSELDLRKFLGGFGFSGEMVFSPIEHFSGGEKSRLALALLVWQKPNLLLLDEPTNHLDLDMRNALSIALQEYAGAMILVSHDRFLVRTTTDKLLLAANHQLQEFDGDLNDYQKWLFHYRRSNEPALPNTQSPSKKELRQQAAKERDNSRPQQQKIKTLETQLQKLQQEAAALEDSLTDQSLYDPTNKDLLQKKLFTLSQLKKSIEETENAWLEANE